MQYICRIAVYVCFQVLQIVLVKQILFNSSWLCLGIVVSLIEEDGLQVESKSRDWL